MGLTTGLNHFFWRYVHGSYEGASRRWKQAIFVMFVLFPGIGSGGSVWFIGMWFVALLHWFFDPDSRRLTPDEKKLVAVFATYFLIMAGFAFAHAAVYGGDTGVSVIITNLPFLLVAPVLPVLRRAVRPGWTAAMFAGFACGAILAVAIITISGQYSEKLLRAGFSGNSLILALGVLISGLLCLHAMLFFRGRMRLLMAAGALASLYVLLISGSRGPLIAYCFAATFYAAIMGYRHFGLRWMAGRTALAIVLLIAIVTVVAQTDSELRYRYNLVVERLSNPTDSSIGADGIVIRLALYEAGLRAALERPLTGHGRQNVLATAKAHSTNVPDRYFNYTHLHNGYLTDLVASGVLGLVSLLLVLLMPLIVFWNARPVVFGGILCLVLAYGFYGATNLLFYHDVVTMLFLAVVGVFNAVAGERNKEATGLK